jgi:Spy/CpxP family protein refolding chaperone
VQETSGVSYFLVNKNTPVFVLKVKSSSTSDLKSNQFFEFEIIIMTLTTGEEGFLMKMKKATLLAVVVVFAFSGISMAGNPGLGGRDHGDDKGNIGMPQGKWWKLPETGDRLGLSTQEKEKLDTLYLEHRLRMIDLHSRAEKERVELEQLFDSSSFDADACLERFRTLEKAHTAFAVERFKFLVQVRELLGLERFSKLKAEVRGYEGTPKNKRRYPSRIDRPVR